MKRSRPFPRRNSAGPKKGSDTSPIESSSGQVDRVVLDPVTLLQQHLVASTLTALTAAAVQPAANAPVPLDQPIRLDQQWRTNLSEIGRFAGLTDSQEAELERLTKSHLNRIQQEIPRLIDELKPHFDTPQEAEAKHRYESGLRVLKTQLDQETAELLHSFGFGRQVSG